MVGRSCSATLTKGRWSRAVPMRPWLVDGASNARQHPGAVAGGTTWPSRPGRLCPGRSLVLIAQIALWYAYYATDAFSNSGLAGGMAFALLPLGISWAATAAAVVVVRRSVA